MRFISQTSENRSLTLKSFSSVQSLSRVRLFATPCQASLSITNSRSSLRVTSIGRGLSPGPPHTHSTLGLPFTWSEWKSEVGFPAYRALGPSPHSGHRHWAPGVLECRRHHLVLGLFLFPWRSQRWVTNWDENKMMQLPQPLTSSSCPKPLPLELSSPSLSPSLGSWCPNGKCTLGLHSAPSLAYLSFAAATERSDSARLEFDQKF